MSDKALLTGLTIATSLLAYRVYNDRKERKLHLPPSPRSYPLIGHFLSIPNEFEHLGFLQLGKQLGSEMFSLSVFGTTMIVLNDKDDVENLFDKRSAIYSDRTCTAMVQEPSLFDWGDFGSSVGYGDRWRKYRRLMNHWLNKQAAVAYHASQEHATRKFLKRLLESPKEVRTSHELEAELYLAISATLLRALYGYEVESSNDALVTRVQKLIEYLSRAMLPSSYLVNSIPALRYVPEWLPGAGWKRDALKWRKEKNSLVDHLYNIGLENMKKDANAHIMAESLRSQALKLGLTEAEADDYAKQISITLVGGGTDTTVGALMMFFYAMVLYPEIQRKAQAELDAVVGSDRLPSINDRARLGYIERIIQETLRWGPIAPLAIPHTCFQDDMYKGYSIPKGAIVFGNVWAMTRNESVYANPDVFDPDRYLDPSTPPSPVFGWGRRGCPGEHFGRASLFITIASVLATFNIGIGQDENGKDVPPSGKFSNTMLLAPKDFVLRLTPRSITHEELIHNIY